MKVCLNCDNIRLSELRPRESLCGYFVEIDMVVGVERCVTPCSVARKDEDLCGVEAKWYKESK